MPSRKLPSLEDLASRLAALIGDNADLLAILDYTAGALFCLMEARRLGFLDRDGPCQPDYAQQVARAVGDMQAGGLRQPYADFWVAGLHVNSAMVRIAASYDRMRKSLGKGAKTIGAEQHKHEKLVKIREEVNSLKHNVDGNQSARQVRFDEAVEGLEELIDFIKAGRK